MNCNELREHYEMYAIGIADDPEGSEIREHLNRGCEVCMEGMRQARQVAALLGGSATPAVPSPRLRRRILASAGFEERRGIGWLSPVLAGALVFSLTACFYFAGRERQVGDDLKRTVALYNQQSQDLSALNEQFSIINGADTTVTSFGTGKSSPPRGKVFVNRQRGVLLIASNLPPAPAGKTYEMWIIPKGTAPAPVPAGLFQSAADGTATHFHRGAVDPNAALVAVTLENAAGSGSPTSQPLFAAPVGSPQ